MSNFHHLDSREGRYRSWGRANQLHRNAILHTSPPSSTSSILFIPTTIGTAAAEITKAANTNTGQSICLQNCLNEFRDSILPHDKDFNKICAVLAVQDDGGSFRSLYICDEGCGVMVGVGQDPNVNWMLSRCQSLGYSNIVDPGPPWTRSSPTTLSSSQLQGDTSIFGLSAQATSSGSTAKGQPAASFVPTSTLPGGNNSPLPGSFTSPLKTFSIGATFVTSSILSSVHSSSVNMYLSTTTTIRTSIVPIVSTVIYTPTRPLSLLPTNIIFIPSYTPTPTPTLPFLSRAPSSTSTSTQITTSQISTQISIPTHHSEMNIETKIGLILAIIGVTFLALAVIIVLYVRYKERVFIRNLVAKYRATREQPTPPRDSESDRCHCISPQPGQETIRIPDPQPRVESPHLFWRLGTQTHLPKHSPKDKQPSSSSSPITQPSHSASVSQDPPAISPIILTVDGIRHELHHPAPNQNLMVDAQGIRWPERVELRGEAKEFLEWSREYDKQDAERRKRDQERREAERRARNYDLEMGRKRKERRFGDMTNSGL